MTNNCSVELPQETLQRYLSDLARIGVRYGVELRPDPGTGCMRIAPISANHRGYYAQRFDDGPRVLLAYDSGRARDGLADSVAGDDMHPAARQERIKHWTEENAEALANERRRAVPPDDPFLTAYRATGGTASPELDLSID